jgi:tetratricopeptide (TPR) repeat protein
MRNNLLRKYPESPNAIFNKGIILCESGEHGNALQLFQKVNILKPGDDEVLYSIGLEMDYLDKHKKSIEY